MPGISVHLQSVRAFLLFFTQKLRLSNPWNFKAPFLITVPYLMLLQSGYTRGDRAFAAIVASVCVIVGVAGFGYLTNDLGDRKKDALIGKENVTGQLPPAAIALLFALFFCLALLPWLYLPFTSISLVLLALQFFLFYAYAFKPLRLKEKGIWGVVTDALYAHVNPALLAAYTFMVFAGAEPASCFLLLLFMCSWQLALGIRNIIFHQLKDHESDLSSGTRTFVGSYGKARSERLLKNVVLPLELILFVAFISVTGHYLETWLLIAACSCFWCITRLRNGWRSGDYRAAAYAYLDDLYIRWLPLFIIALLVLHSWSYAGIAVLHLLLFRNGLKDLWKHF